MARSPNFGPRRDDARPDLIVLHYTAMPDWRAARDWLCNPQSQVSAHYIISEQGDTLCLVDEDMRAWHAGVGAWGGVTDVNSRSIGIELNNIGTAPFAAPLMDALETLLPEIMQRWAIPPHRVIAHSDLAPGRKIDPGPRFDWARLARADLAVTAKPDAHAHPVTEATFHTLAGQFGYDAGLPHDTLLPAFRLRHRPRHEGPLDTHDIALAANLAQRFPIDPNPMTS